MESLYLLIPVAIALAALAIKAFFWAVDNEQFDDLDAAAHSILFEEEPSEGSDNSAEPAEKQQKDLKDEQ